MHKLFGFIVISVITLQGFAQDTTRIVNSAQTIEASSQELSNVRDITSSIIKDVNQAAPLFDKFLIIGPRLWNILQSDKDFQGIEGGNVTFKIPKFNNDGGWSSKEDVQGKAFQDIIHYLKLWSYFKNNYDLEKSSIVEANKTDKYLFWQYFAKIEQPYVILRNDKARLILKYVDGKLFFIELSRD